MSSYLYQRQFCRQWLVALVVGYACLCARADEWTVTRQRETAPGSGRYHRVSERQTWSPNKTAFIVCDMWDSHHCLNAVRRVGELAPRIDRVLAEARRRGAIVIHAPSGCMDFYRDHPARTRATSVPQAAKLPPQITQWCSQIPAEEQVVYPIDQSDGGEDDNAIEHRQWATQLQALGRDPKRPWTRQTVAIEIDPARDYISDRGDEIWSILQQHDIGQVVLCGVHTNMCVLGRPFGLRQMVRNNMPVVLLRDLTDTMYNPARPPFVSHFSGTDLIINHIERHICPTIASTALLDGEREFRFRGDRRLHIAVIVGEEEYETRRTLTRFAEEHLRKQYRLSFAYADPADRNSIPGLTDIHDVDLVVMSIRRRVLPPDQLNWFRHYLDLGQPLVALRTSSHAFHLRKQAPPPGHAAWPEFDQQILGGNYHDHFPNTIRPTIEFAGKARNHPVMAGITANGFTAGGSLYLTSPVREGACVLAMGKIDGHPAEPAAWTFVRANGGRTFYAALGHKQDFADPVFEKLLANAIGWCAGHEPPQRAAANTVSGP